MKDHLPNLVPSGEFPKLTTCCFDALQGMWVKSLQDILENVIFYWESCPQAALLLCHFHFIASFENWFVSMLYKQSVLTFFSHFFQVILSDVIFLRQVFILLCCGQCCGGPVRCLGRAPRQPRVFLHVRLLVIIFISALCFTGVSSQRNRIMWEFVFNL